MLDLLTSGASQKQIADALSISSKTVSTHIQKLLVKMGVHSRAELVSHAFLRGLVSPPGDWRADGNSAARSPNLPQLRRNAVRAVSRHAETAPSSKASSPAETLATASASARAAQRVRRPRRRRSPASLNRTPRTSSCTTSAAQTTEAGTSGGARRRPRSSRLRLRRRRAGAIAARARCEWLHARAREAL